MEEINMKSENNQNSLNLSFTRRSFLKASGVLGTVAMVKPVFAIAAEPPLPQLCTAVNLCTGENLPDPMEKPENIVYSVCQMCHSRCGIRAKVIDGILVKLDGNPYHPNNRDIDEYGDPDRLDYATTPGAAFMELGRVCLKAQSGVQTLYDPYRIQQPLKRVGLRNSGKWETITWDQAFQEIAAKINTLIPPATRNDPIDPLKPELGPKRNQLAFAPGRSVEKEMSERVWKRAWGTVNHTLDHTSVCEATRHVANELITWNPKGTQNSKGGGRSEGWQADTLGAEFIIFFGANPLEANFPMVGMARNLMHFRHTGRRYVVVDPRHNNSAAKGEWLPIKPGTDGALAMAMIQSIIGSNGHDINYLRNANKAAANAIGEPTWSDSTYLVGTFTDSGGKTFQHYLKPWEVSLTTDQDGAPFVYDSSKPLNNNYYVVAGGAGAAGLTAVNVDSSTAVGVVGNLEYTGSVQVNGRPIKTAFTLLREAAFSQTVAQYSAICDVPVATIQALAADFVSHGKKAAAISYRGAVKHTNGLYNQLAIQHLNTLIGNYDWKGGSTAGAGGWSNKSGVVQLDKVAGAPVGAGVEGIRIDRAMTFYEEAGSLFPKLPDLPYPAKRPWFPFGLHGNYQEVIPSIQQGYPYPIKVLITYWNAWPYSVPTLKKVWEATVADETKVPLLVTISPVMGEVAAWADYILPDTVYLEKFSAPGIPWRVNKGTSFQQPVVGSFANNGDYKPYLSGTKSVLDIHIGLAKALDLPGFGNNALLSAGGNSVGHLDNSFDWAEAMLENIAYNYAAATGISITPEEILSKGGVFDNQGDEYIGDKLRYQYGNIIRLFTDPIARTKDSVTGQYYSGVPHYESLRHSDGTLVSEGSGYPLRLITYKVVHHGQSRTIINPWLRLMVPENFIEISALDASSRKIQTGDKIKITSPSNTIGIIGKARVTQGLKPGVIAVSHHFGHWEMSSKSTTINGVATGYDPSRGLGIQPNLVMRTDRKYTNVSLQEPIGGSCAFYDTMIQITKV
jgi:anaerobic selenocysteine-containing dehydrogenase